MVTTWPSDLEQYSCTALHCTALHCTALHHVAIFLLAPLASICRRATCAPLLRTALHCTALQQAPHSSAASCPAVLAPRIPGRGARPGIAPGLLPHTRRLTPQIATDCHQELPVDATRDCQWTPPGIASGRHHGLPVDATRDCQWTPPWIASGHHQRLSVDATRDCRCLVKSKDYQCLVTPEHLRRLRPLVAVWAA
jgi:hypothetical protein